MNKIIVKNCRTVELPTFQDGKDGCLSVAEGMPFQIKRVYYIYDLNNNAVRGKHAHKKLEQVIFCVNGDFVMEVEDGRKKDFIALDKPNVGLYIGPDVWHIISCFSEDCIILVLASDYYDESDYIRNYSQFKRDRK